MNLIQKIKGRLEKSEDCLVWTGAKTNDGYGRISRNGKLFSVHRVIWEDANGPIQSGLCVCHKCDNPSCANLNHLFLGTPSDNMADKVRKGRHVVPLAFIENGAKGERNRSAKLLPADVIAIRSTARAVPTALTAARYGITTSAVNRIIQRNTWRHI